MRIPTRINGLSATVAIALLAGCSGGGFWTTPRPPSPQVAARFAMGRAHSALSPMGPHIFNTQAGEHFLSNYACPATGAVEYLSDYKNNVINVYAGKFAGQAPCGKLTSGLVNPQGEYINTNTHDLYVANTGAHNILVFHRGQIGAYNSFTDPTGQYPYDVTIAKDGTVIASNIFQSGGTEKGSLSTWIGGPHGGKFVGNFPMTNDVEGLYVTVEKNDRVYYSDVDATTRNGALWTLTCPSGACGHQTRVAGVAFNLPGGLAFDNTNDLLATDAQPGTLETFELPNPKPKKVAIAGGSLDLAIDRLNRHIFVSDSKNNNAAEYAFPSGVLVGTVPCGTGCIAAGIAVDR